MVCLAPTVEFKKFVLPSLSPSFHSEQSPGLQILAFTPSSLACLPSPNTPWTARAQLTSGARAGCQQMCVRSWFPSPSLPPPSSFSKLSFGFRILSWSFSLSEFISLLLSTPLLQEGAVSYIHSCRHSHLPLSVPSSQPTTPCPKLSPLELLQTNA